MTIQEKIAQMLLKAGVSPDKATKVIDALKADRTTISMIGRWNDDVSGYQSMLIVSLYMRACYLANGL